VSYIFQQPPSLPQASTHLPAQGLDRRRAAALPGGGAGPAAASALGARCRGPRWRDARRRAPPGGSEGQPTFGCRNVLAPGYLRSGAWLPVFSSTHSTNRRAHTSAAHPDTNGDVQGLRFKVGVVAAAPRRVSGVSIPVGRDTGRAPVWLVSGHSLGGDPRALGELFRPRVRAELAAVAAIKWQALGAQAFALRGATRHGGGKNWRVSTASRR
jgi:hypothetical protein